MWYVIQTVTGKEEELIAFIRTVLNKELYADCFIIKTEWLKRLGGEWLTQVEPLFPGYVFIETERPKDVFMELKCIPRFTRMLGNENFEFVAVRKEEKELLELLLCGERDLITLVGLTMAPSGLIQKIEDKYQFLYNHIIRLNLHKRYLIIKVKICGVIKTVKLGIHIMEDEGQNVIFNRSSTSG